MGVGKATDLSVVAAVTDVFSGADLEHIVNEAAIRAVRCVSRQLNSGTDKKEVDTTVYPEDFEASIISFFQSRREKKKGHLGFAIPRH